MESETAFLQNYSPPLLDQAWSRKNMDQINPRYIGKVVFKKDYSNKYRTQ